MALVDFYQLAVLHKLSRCDVGILSDRSHPPPMPGATPSSSRLPPDRPDRAALSTTLSTQLVPGKSGHKRDATRYSTPFSVGTSILQRLNPDADRAQKYASAKCEQYIAQDFERHRVFIDMEVFMKCVLHVPEGWRELWGQTIEDIKKDKVFSFAYACYSNQCDTPGAHESEFYKPLVEMANAILDFSAEPSSDNSVKPTTPQRYLRNDPQRVLRGVMNDLSPDIVAVHEDFLPHLLLGERNEQRLRSSSLTWAQPLQILEVKPWDNALIDGSRMPRLKVDGQDPQRNHARAYTPSRFRNTGTLDARQAILDETASAPEPPLRKRLADESSGSSRKTAKVHHKSTPGGANGQGPKRKPMPPQINETKQQRDAHLQVGRYLLEQFSIPAFRSHITIGLVDRDRIQFYHANHSVILVSSAIDFSSANRAGGLDMFIAIVIAFGRLSLCNNGILHNLHGGELFQDNEKLLTSDLTQGAMRVQEGNELKFKSNGRTFTVTYGELISHEPSLAGRSTAVLHATSARWWRTELVIKISWPGSDRVAENKFLARATEFADRTRNKWALNHLPRIVFSKDVRFGKNSTHEKVARLFQKAEFVNGEYEYERRTLRIIIQERLYPLKTLTNVRDIAQVLLDVACIHRWLYVHAGILQRDLSLSNIMYRIVKKKNKKGVVEEKIYGVLTDFDLASWREDLKKDHTKTSQQRTGTPPYMAHGLLNGKDNVHLYRHDMESLFYIMLILSTHYEIQVPTEEKNGGLRMRQGLEELPFQAWFGQPSYRMLASCKRDFFTYLESPNLSPDFEDFRSWLWDLHVSFRHGMRAKEIHDESVARWKGGGSEHEAAPEFDNETLGGCFDYSALINPVRKLKGGLEGLIIRYDPPPSTSDGSAGTGS